MTRVWVIEYLSAGGAVDDPAEAAALMAQGVAMRDALTLDLLCIPDVEVSVAWSAPAPAPIAGATTVPIASDAGLVAFVGAGALAFDAVWAIAPETGGTLAALERAVDPVCWLGCEAGAIGIASSKGSTLRALAGAGLPTPLDWVDRPSAAPRWVVKPDDGAGTCATRVHPDRAAAEADRARRRAVGESAWAEPFIDGEPLSLSLMCRREQAELLAVNRLQVISQGPGRLRYRGVVIDACRADDARWQPLAAIARGIAQALPGLWGFVGVDLVWHPRHGPVLIEVNPRLTCSYIGLSGRLRRNLAGEVLAADAERCLEPAHA